MAFASTIDTPNNSPVVVGNVKMSWGTYTSSGGGTGGDIDTGLDICDCLQLQPKGSSVVADMPAVNETLPGLAGSAVTIVTTANEVGTWFAIGPR